jgi:hypothetical protein
MTPETEQKLDAAIAAVKDFALWHPMTVGVLAGWASMGVFALVLWAL